MAADTAVVALGGDFEPVTARDREACDRLELEDAAREAQLQAWEETQ